MTADLDQADLHFAAVAGSPAQRYLESKFEERAVVDFEQPIRDMDAEIRSVVDPPQNPLSERAMRQEEILGR